MSSDRTTRTNTLRFGHGTATILVDHWPSNPQGTLPVADEIACTVDHLMGTVVQDTFKAMSALNRSVLSERLGEGDVSHASTRSMSIDDVTMRVKVSLRVYRAVPSYVLAVSVDEILKGAAPCMIHLLDKSLNNAEMPPGLAGILSDLLGGGMPEGMGVMGFPADLFAGMTGSEPRGHQAHDGSEGHWGQYL